MPAAFIPSTGGGGGCEELGVARPSRLSLRGRQKILTPKQAGKPQIKKRGQSELAKEH